MPPSADSRRAVVSYWRKYVYEVLGNRLGGLSLPRKSVVRLTDRPDMTLDVYRGRKTTQQQQQLLPKLCIKNYDHRYRNRKNVTYMFHDLFLYFLLFDVVSFIGVVFYS